MRNLLVDSEIRRSGWPCRAPDAPGNLFFTQAPQTTHLLEIEQLRRNVDDVERL